MNVTRNRQGIRLAVQKSGRLNDRTLDLLRRAGIDFDAPKNRLVCKAYNFPIEIMLVRDDDIPGYVRGGACDLGIVGFNEYHEQIESIEKNTSVEIVRKLGFGKCRLGLAVPSDRALEFQTPENFAGKRIATSYPNSLKYYFEKAGVSGVETVDIAGSVEIAPSMGIADAICDLVSTGQTLKANGLSESATLFESEAVLIGDLKRLEPKQAEEAELLLKRIDGVMKAARSKYIMMNAPKEAVQKIQEVVPGLESPTVLPLTGQEGKVAVHVVAAEEVFWETMEHLKELGASSILVVPIEKMLD